MKKTSADVWRRQQRQRERDKKLRHRKHLLKSKSALDRKLLLRPIDKESYTSRKLKGRDRRKLLRLRKSESNRSKRMKGKSTRKLRKLRNRSN